MTSDTDEELTRRRPKLVPRLRKQGYSDADIELRRQWVEAQTGASLEHVGRCSLAGETLRGNIENPIGSVQTPLGVAGPLHVRGEHADGVFYVPMATSEGTVVRSYERGMVALTRAGGAEARLYNDENRVSPIFLFDDAGSAHAFAQRLPAHIEPLRAAAASTTRHGALLRVEPQPVGRKLILNCVFSTGDAQGMNMAVKATEAVCTWLRRHLDAPDYYIFSGYNAEKRAAGSLFAGGKGKRAVAGARIPAAICTSILHASPEELVRMWQHTVIGHLQTAALGYNGHLANGLTALFLATGQDVANVANAAVGITVFELTADGDLYASVTLPALTIATVGGGTALGTSHECLRMLDCVGSGKARKFAEITVAMALAGELSMGGAIASGEVVEAHEAYGRNRPAEEGSSQ